MEQVVSCNYRVWGIAPCMMLLRASLVPRLQAWNETSSVYCDILVPRLQAWNETSSVYRDSLVPRLPQLPSLHLASFPGLGTRLHSILQWDSLVDSHPYIELNIDRISCTIGTAFSFCYTQYGGVRIFFGKLWSLCTIVFQSGLHNSFDLTRCPQLVTAKAATSWSWSHY